MTEQQKPSFNEVSDQAAAALKQKFGLPQKQVQVGSDGHPSPPPPPPGSYAAMIREQSREAAQPVAVNEAPLAQQTTQDPVGSAPPEEERHIASENAQRRIQELVGRVKETEQALQAERSRVSASEEELARLRAKQEQQIQTQLDNMDPQARDEVLADARVEELFARQRQEFERKLKPLAEKAWRDDLERVAARYSGFRYDVHPELIRIFRQQNPNMTVEQAFRAVAEPDEIVPHSARASTPPPTLAPNTGSVPMSLPTEQKTPEQQEAEARASAMERILGLAGDRTTAGRRTRDQLIREELARRTGI